jgi:hypothetical protein
MIKYPAIVSPTHTTHPFVTGAVLSIPLWAIVIACMR